MQPDRKEEGHALAERALKGPDTGRAMAACRVTPLLIPETRRAVQHRRGTNAVGCGVAVPGLDSAHLWGQHSSMTQSVCLPVAPRRDGRLSLCVTDQLPDTLSPAGGVALVRVVRHGEEMAVDDTPSGWAGVWTWCAPRHVAFGAPAPFSSDSLSPGSAVFAPVRRGPVPGGSRSRGLVAESLPSGAGHVGSVGRGLGSGSPGSVCACCTGAGGLDRFLLARAQEHVRGAGPAFHAVVVLCPAGTVEQVRAMVAGSGLLAGFYSLEPPA